MNKIKFLLCFALMVSGVEGWGQIYINSYRFGEAAPATLLLDDYPNASAAYSVRKLRTAYAGNALRVRRVNGDTSSIGFASNFLDTVALKNFCGTASTDTCWVRDWFDQSGNAVNFTQSTNANQPFILISGKIVYKGDILGIDFDGTNDFFGGNIMTDYLTVSTFSNFNVINADTIVRSAGTSTNDIIWGDDDQYVGVELARNANRAIGWNYDTNYDSLQTNISLNTKYVINFFHYGGNIYFSINNNADASKASGNTGASTRVMRLGFNKTGAGYFNGKMHEVVFYKTDQSANKSGINSNINAFYSIY